MTIPSQKKIEQKFETFLKKEFKKVYDGDLVTMKQWVEAFPLERIIELAAKWHGEEILNPPQGEIDEI